jgi:hypothetical protein
VVANEKYFAHLAGAFTHLSISAIMKIRGQPSPLHLGDGPPGNTVSELSSDVVARPEARKLPVTPQPLCSLSPF